MSSRTLVGVLVHLETRSVVDTAGIGASFSLSSAVFGTDLSLTRERRSPTW
jgi:hypothetical protein